MSGQSYAMILFYNGLQMISNREWRKQTNKKQQRPGKSWSSLLQCFPISWHCSVPKSLLGVDYNGITAWRYCPSGANWITITWIRAAWLNNQQQRKWKMPEYLWLLCTWIRTEVSVQSEQTQEVVLIKHYRVQNIEISYNREKMKKKKMDLN